MQFVMFSLDNMKIVSTVPVGQLSGEERSTKNANKENCGGKRLLPLLTAHQVKLENLHSFHFIGTLKKYIKELNNC